MLWTIVKYSVLGLVVLYIVYVVVTDFWLEPRRFKKLPEWASQKPAEAILAYLEYEKQATEEQIARYLRIPLGLAQVTLSALRLDKKVVYSEGKGLWIDWGYWIR